MDQTAPVAVSPAEPLPLVERRLDEVIAWAGPAGDAARAITVGAFLADVRRLAATLPAEPFAINLCTDRYRFLVGFCAALLRGQTSLMTSDRSPHRLGEIAKAYPGAYVLGGPPAEAAGLRHCPVLPGGTDAPAATAMAPKIPTVPADHLAAIVFTSGSTGEPVANRKPFAALAQCSRAAGRRFGLDGPVTRAVVGTVPGQHMYGFETTILLPLHANCATFAGTTFFPQDVALALAAVPAPRLLVTTPLQMKNLLASGIALPPLEGVVSATAPLPVEDAQAAETAWQTRVWEIFGATEVGSIASRRTVEGDLWQLYDGVRLDVVEEECVSVSVPFLPHPVELGDRTLLVDRTRFRLLGRRADIVKRGGKRASLSGLTAILKEIEGVEDAVFMAPPGLEQDARARLLAFVVAPGRPVEAILADLRQRVEPAFLPRRLVGVDALPRNEVGKITQAALLRLASEAPTGPVA